jgi:hypothetical protein
MGVAGAVRIQQPKAQRAIHADMGEPDQRQRHGKTRPGKDPDQPQGSRGRMGVGQVVGHGTDMLASQLAEEAKVGDRQQHQEQPPRPSVLAV